MARANRFSKLGFVALLCVFLSGCSTIALPPMPTASATPPPGVPPVRPPTLGILYATENEGMVGRAVPTGQSTTTYSITSVQLFNEVINPGTRSEKLINLDQPILVRLDPAVVANLTSDQVQDHPLFGDPSIVIPVLPTDGPHEFIIPFSTLTRILPRYVNNLKVGCRISFQCQDPQESSRRFQSAPYTITPPPPTPQTTLANRGSFRVYGTFDTSGVTGLTVAKRQALSQKLYSDGLKALDRLLSKWGMRAQDCYGTNGPTVQIDGIYWGSGYQTDVFTQADEALKKVATNAGVSGVKVTGFSLQPNGPFNPAPFAKTVPAGHSFSVSVSLHAVGVIVDGQRETVLNAANRDLLAAIRPLLDITAHSTTAISDSAVDMTLTFRGKSRTLGTIDGTLTQLRDAVASTMGTRTANVVVADLALQESGSEAIP